MAYYGDSFALLTYKDITFFLPDFLIETFFSLEISSWHVPISSFLCVELCAAPPLLLCVPLRNTSKSSAVLLPIVRRQTRVQLYRCCVIRQYVVVII
jgi:hypothetical protein